MQAVTSERSAARPNAKKVIIIALVLVSLLVIALFVNKVYQASQPAALPQGTVTISQSVLEAQYTGLPVLTTNCGGVMDFINEENGIIIENDRSEETLLKGMIDMMDKLKRFDRTEIARRSILKFSEKLIKEKYFEIYNRLLIA